MTTWSDDASGYADPSVNRGATWVTISTFRTRVEGGEFEGNNAGDPAREYYAASTSVGAAQRSRIRVRLPLEAGAGSPGNAAGCGAGIRVNGSINGGGAGDNGYFLVVNGVTAERFQVYRCNAGDMGPATPLFGYTAAAPANGDLAELRIDANWGLFLLVNDVEVATFDDAPNTTLRITGGYVGDYGLIVNEVIRWDDWEGGDVTAGGAPSPVIFAQRRVMRAA